MYPMLGGTKNRPITTSTLIRPPSRHKTPNKNMGLDAQSLGLNSKSKNRPNTSKNNKTNFNLINNKRES